MSINITWNLTCYSRKKIIFSKSRHRHGKVHINKAVKEIERLEEKKA